MLGLIPRLPSYALFRSMGWPKPLPLNLTISVTYKCNSRCRTCNIYQKTSDELALEEWRQVFYSLQRAPFWVTFSGGEPFLRDDLLALVKAMYRTCRPSIINIPTNGLLTGRIPGWVNIIARRCSDAQIIVNLSVDELEGRHDRIRGVEGNFARVMETFHALKELKLSNLSIGFHTVISKFNVDCIPVIYNYLMARKPDSYVAEIAEEREELGTIGCDIAPDLQAYAGVTAYLIKALTGAQFGRMGKVARVFRLEYYRIAKRILEEKRQVIPCYAGVASAQIAPDGAVWACCTRAVSMGDLRDYGYDFKGVWFSEKADQIRNDIKTGRCWCPLANVGYTNMLFHPRTLLRVGRNYAVGN
ncbi:MAG: radical SAM/SPASM domain-containing protein [Desulfobacteraceae bacterium]